MATSPIGSPRAEAPGATVPPGSSGAAGPRQCPARSGPLLPTRNAVPGPPPPRAKLTAGPSAGKSPATKSPAIQALQQLELEFDKLPPSPVESAGEASQRAAMHTLTDLALRITQQRAELPRDKAVRAISDKKFAGIMSTAALRKQKVLDAAIDAYNEAMGPVQDQMDRDAAAYLDDAVKHGGSTGQVRHFALVVARDRAGRVAKQAMQIAKLNQGLQQDYKEHIALCEAALTVHWTLDPRQIRNFEDTLMTARLHQLHSLSRQVNNHGKLLIWDCVNPHPQVFAGMEIKALLSVVEQLTAYDPLQIAGRACASPPLLELDLLSAEEKETIDDIRIAAADCAAYMAALANKVHAGSGVIFTGQSDRGIRDQAVQHLRHLEATGWELADMAATLLQPAQPQATEPSAPEKHPPQAKPRARQKARGKKPPAARVPTRPATSRSEEASPAMRLPVDAPQPMAAAPWSPAPSARAARALVSHLTALVGEQDPRPAQRQELQQLRKVGTPEKVISTMQGHARQWEIGADKILAAHQNLEARHLLLLGGDELRQASSLKDQAAAMAAELRGEAQALTRNLAQVKHDLMKTYLLPAQTHWDELLKTGQAKVPSPPQALPTSPPDTLFEVELQPTPLAGQKHPPPSVWLHLHTHQAADAAGLGALPLEAFAAMHLKSNVERRRGRNWLAKQAAEGVPAQLIHRGEVDKRFVAKVLDMSPTMQSAPAAASAGRPRMSPCATACGPRTHEEGLMPAAR